MLVGDLCQHMEGATSCDLKCAGIWQNQLGYASVVQTGTPLRGGEGGRGRERGEKVGIKRNSTYHQSSDTHIKALMFWTESHPMACIASNNISCSCLSAVCLASMQQYHAAWTPSYLACVAYSFTGRVHLHPSKRHYQVCACVCVAAGACRRPSRYLPHPACCLQ